jgi:transketolase
MLQYALLHLYGYALSIDDLKAFRVSLHHTFSDRDQGGE